MGGPIVDGFASAPCVLASLASANNLLVIACITCKASLVHLLTCLHLTCTDVVGQPMQHFEASWDILSQILSAKQYRTSTYIAYSVPRDIASVSVCALNYGCSQH